MMDELLKSVYEIVIEEYNRASKTHGDVMHTPHEAFAIILEEAEESSEELGKIRTMMLDIWGSVRADDSQEMYDTYKKMLDTAMHGAAEMIQVAAMIHKALVSNIFGGMTYE